MLKEIKEKAPKMNSDNKENIYINVLIREKKFKQYCGNGIQKIRWLTDCAIYKYEISSEQKVTCGPAYGLKMENGSLCDLNNTIASTLVTGANVLVLLKEEYDVEMEDKSKKKDDNDKQINLVNNFYDEPDEYNDREEEDYNSENDENDEDDQNEEMHYLPLNDNNYDSNEEENEGKYNEEQKYDK